MINLKVLLVTMALAGSSFAQFGFATLSQSIDSVNVGVGMVTCNTAVPGTATPQYHVQNSFWRAYDLAAEGITTPIDITCVRFGVEIATAGSNGEQPLELRLYVQPAPTSFPNITPTGPTHTELFTVADSGNASNIVITQGLSAVVTAQPTDVVIVELFMPTGAPGAHNFFPGSNTAGQTADGYLSAPGCGITTPTGLGSAVLGLANPPHLILDLVYVLPAFTPSPTLSINILGADPMTGLTTFTVTNGDLLPGHEIWNFYSGVVCPGQGPYLGLCFPNPGDLLAQLATPLGVEPLRYLAVGCDKTMGPFAVPTGITLEVVCVDFDSTTGSLNGWSPKVTQTF